MTNTYIDPYYVKPDPFYTLANQPLNEHEDYSTKTGFGRSRTAKPKYKAGDKVLAVYWTLIDGFVYRPGVIVKILHKQKDYIAHDHFRFEYEINIERTAIPHTYDYSQTQWANTPYPHRCLEHLIEPAENPFGQRQQSINVEQPVNQSECEESNSGTARTI